MASIPRAPDPLKKYRVKISDRKGKIPTVLTVEWQATSQKEAERAVRQFILGGKFETQEVSEDEKRPSLGLRR